jgi:stage II sporulation protein E
MAAGFVSALGSSGISAVSFALVGLVSGLLFPYGVGGALLSAGAAASAWSIYASGVEGLLSILPEYAIAATIAAPMMRSLHTARPEDKAASLTSAGDMVGIFSLSYKNKFSGSLDRMEASMASISSVLRSISSRPDAPTEEELRRVIEDSATDVCEGCGEFLFCKSEDVFPAEKNKENLLEILMRGERVLPSNINTTTEFCATPELIAERINLKVAELYRRKFQSRASLVGADQYDLLGKLISEARLADRREKAQDTPLTERLTKVLQDMGFRGASVKVFGERKKRFIIAMEDEDGKDITRPEILRKIEEVCGLPVAAPEFFRKDKCALMECGVGRGFEAEVAFSSSSGGTEVSGDSLTAFSSDDDRFYAICSDGMGSGEEAKRTSDFACKFLKCALGIGSPETALHLLNSTLLGRGGECSATIDIFALDLFDGSATFIKSGAAPSFVKRGGRLFRIQSKTLPIGIVRAADAEQVSYTAEHGDIIIMQSDGVAQSYEDCPWMANLLTRCWTDELATMCVRILDAAEANNKENDDRSVCILRIIEF